MDVHTIRVLLSARGGLGGRLPPHSLDGHVPQRESGGVVAAYHMGVSVCVVQPTVGLKRTGE